MQQFREPLGALGPADFLFSKMYGFAVSSNFEKVGSVPKVIKTIFIWQDGPGSTTKAITKKSLVLHVSDDRSQLSSKETFRALTAELARPARASSPCPYILWAKPFKPLREMKPSGDIKLSRWTQDAP